MKIAHWNNKHRPNRRGGPRVLQDGLVPKPPKKPYQRKPLWFCKAKGRQSWLRTVGPEVLRFAIDKLNCEKTLLKITQLQRVLGMSYPTLLRLLKDCQVEPVEQPIRWHPERGHEVIKGQRQRFYDPVDLIGPIQRRLHGMGSELVNMEEGPGWGQLDFSPREAPVLKAYSRRTAWHERQTRLELEGMIEEGPMLLQWLTPKETASWLGVTLPTLLRWRNQFDETKDYAKYPPYHQGPDLVPSYARDPRTGLRVTTTRRATARGSSFRRRYDPVLYDRNQVLAWLRQLLVQK